MLRLIISLLILYGLWSFFVDGTKEPEIKTYINDPTPTYSNPSYKTNTYVDGYEWAEMNDIDNFSDCQSEFGTGYEEDECNRYVKENYANFKTFNSYECTEDCSGHNAGYRWAEDKGIEDVDDCSGRSNSFIEGCISYVEENY